MRLVKRAGESEFVRAFLAADLESPRDNSRCVSDDLKAKGLDQSVLLGATTSSSNQDEALRSILDHCHGLTLEGLPIEKTNWHHAELLDTDSLYLMDLDDFRIWTGGTLIPSDAIAGFRRERSLDEFIGLIRQGWTIRPIICVARTWSSPAVVLDGSQRAAAHAALGTSRPLPVLLGLSDDIGSWKFFPERFI